MSSALSHGISGLIASCYATTCTYPLDIARTRLQVQTKDEREYTGTLDVIFKVLKNEGLGGLYAGLSSQYIMTSSTNFLYYFFYNYLQTSYTKWLESKAKTTNNNNNNKNGTNNNGSKPKAGVFATLAIGVLAGCITQFIINPLSVAITRIKGKKPPLGHNIIKTIYLIGVQEGMGALYSGLNASLILTINPSIEFLIFDKLTKYYMMIFNKRPDQISVMILGAISKIIATLVTYPYTMAKSRLQSSSSLRISTMQILRKIITEEGFFALYIGLQAQLLKSALFSAFRSQGKEKITAVVSSIIK